MGSGCVRVGGIHADSHESRIPVLRRKPTLPEIYWYMVSIGQYTNIKASIEQQWISFGQRKVENPHLVTNMAFQNASWPPSGTTSEFQTWLAGFFEVLETPTDEAAKQLSEYFTEDGDITLAQLKIHGSQGDT